MNQKQWMTTRIAGAPLHGRNTSCDELGCRPVAVIDPENVEQVERLLVDYLSRYDGCTVAAPQDEEIDCLRAALREFANPTPPKPQGLGAVVEDDEGELWIRNGNGMWIHAEGKAFPCAWTSISAVRVLSEGVKAGDDR